MTVRRRVAGAALTVIGCLLLAAPGRAYAQAPDAAQANRSLAERFVAIWNAHDMAPLADLLTTDADWVNVDAGHGPGRDLTSSATARSTRGRCSRTA